LRLLVSHRHQISARERVAVAWIRVAASAGGPWLVAGLLLAADVVTAVRHDVLPIRHEVIGVLTVWAGVWAICGALCRHYGSAPRLKDGERIVTDAEAERMEAAAWRAVEMADRRVREAGGRPPRALRAVSGDR
jgi:hypothetical protein